MTRTARKRADGEASSRRILDAAAAVAGERGFHGTSISAVSERSGLPASSIYWHFANKDELIAAVIDRSYRQWIESLDAPDDTFDGSSPEEAFHGVIRRVGATLGDFGDFLRLGLLLLLDHNPDEPTARARFLEVRAATAERIERFHRTMFDDLGDDAIEQLTTLTLVLSDGVFIARDADDLDRDAAYDLMATAILGTVRTLRGR